MGRITIIWESQCHKPTRTGFFLPVKKRKANLGVVIGNSTSWNELNYMSGKLRFQPVFHYMAGSRRVKLTIKIMAVQGSTSGGAHPRIHGTI